MKTLTVYSSLPVVSPRLACAFYALAAEGVQLELRPLAELGTARRLLGLEQELLTLALRLVEIGDRLTQADYGLLRLEVGEEPGLKAERDDLRSRQRGVLATIEALKGGLAGG